MVIHDVLWRPGTITVDWKICTICNYKCSYCYVRPMSIWGQVASKSNIDIVLDRLSKCSYKVDLSILGGEPTLHPLLLYILSRCESIDNITGVNLITNASKPVKKYLEYKKVFLICSWHPFNSVNFENNIKDLQRDRYSVSIMIHPDGTYPRWLYDHPYTEEFIVQDDNIIEHSNTPQYVVDGNIISEHDLELLTNLNFYEWNCKISHFSIDPDATVTPGCLSKVKLTTSSLDPVLIKCDKHKCVWSCMLGMLKYDSL